MKITKSRGIRYTILLAFLMLAFAVIPNLYPNSNVTPAPHFHGIGRWVAESPIFSILPKGVLERWGIPILRKQNADALNAALEVFDPSLKPFLTAVPIILDSSANTAKSYPARGYIAVSPDWDNSVSQSQFRQTYEERGMKGDDPVFVERFKTNLFIHEFLHILQRRLGIDNSLIYPVVERWYLDPRYGKPSANGVVRSDAGQGGKPDVLVGNRIKYVVWQQLYNYKGLSEVPQDGSWKRMQYVGRYRFAKSGVEEFAYIGEEILASGSGSQNFIKTGKWREADWMEKKMRLLEVSPEVIALYRGVFNPRVLQ